MRPTLIALAGLAVTVILSNAVAEPLSVKLSAVERAGVDRVAEPVTFGAPLPAGAVSDPQTLCLLDEQGRAIPASFSVAQKWVAQPGRPGEGSARWVHVSCLLDVRARQSRTLTLTDQPPTGVTPGDAKGLAQKLSVTADAKTGRATIDTGVARLVLDANHAGVIAQAVFAGRKVISQGSAAVQAGTGRLGKIEPATAQVEVLEAGPVRAVVLLRGKFAESNVAGKVATHPKQTFSDKGVGDGPGLIYEARVYAYAGSGRVAIDYTLINKIGATAAHKIDLSDLALDWRLAGAPAGAVTFGTGDAPWVGKLLTRASVLQDDVDHYQIQADDRTVAEGKTKSARPLTLGWANVNLDQAGLAIGVRDFWQTYPKRLSLTSQKAFSAVHVGLFPQEAGRVQELFIGQARTHRITLLLHDGKAAPADLNAVFAAANDPLLPVAPPSWYCQQTQCWGPITSADADYGAFADVEKHYDRIMSESMDAIERNVQVGLTDKDITQDGYGWLNWGDSFFRKAVEGPMFAEPHKNQSWNGNYYDYAMAMVFQFFRTGDRRYLDHGLRGGLYTADVFINHWWPEPERIGACHYCPPRYHAAKDDGVPYVSEQFNHAKVASVVMRWQLLGDWWARQVMFETFNHAEAMVGSEGAAWRQCRGNGHRLHMLAVAYQFTGEKKYVERADKLLKLGCEFIRKNTEFDKRPAQRFMVGIALEGMIQQYWIHPQPELLETIKFIADYAAREQHLKGYTANMAFAYGFLWQQTGEEYYLKQLATLVRLTGSTRHAKYFGQTFRAGPFAMGYLNRAAGKGVKLDLGRAVAPSSDEFMQVQPTSSPGGPGRP